MSRPMKVHPFGVIDHDIQVTIMVRWLESTMFKATISIHKIILQNTHMTALYTNLSFYITFTLIYYIRQE